MNNNKQNKQNEQNPIKEIIEQVDKNQKVELIIKQDDVQEEEGIDLKELILKIIKGKKVIAFITLLAFVVSTIGLGVYTLVGKEDKGVASLIVAFNYDGIDKGLDPMGKTFDPSEMKYAEIIDKTIQSLNLQEKNLTVEDIRSNISIDGIIPQDVMERILIINKMAEKDPTRLQELNDLEYHPVQYRLSLKIEKGWKLSQSEAKEVLNTIIENYKEYFITKYADTSALSTAVTKIDFERYDYPEYAMLAESQLKVIRSYLEAKATKAPDFRSKETQMTFGDIISQLEVLESIDLNSIQALINSFVLTKDSDKLIATYENRILKLQLDVEKNEQQAKSLREQANTYKKDSNVMIMGDGTGTTVPMTEPSETYDNLVEQAAAKTAQATAMKADIEYYTELVSRLRNNTISSQVEGSASSITPAIKEKYSKQVESQITTLSEEMDDLINLTIKTTEDYFQTEVFKDGVKVSVPAVYSSNTIGALKTLVIGIGAMTVLGFIIGILVTLGKGFLRKEDLDEGISA